MKRLITLSITLSILVYTLIVPGCQNIQQKESADINIVVTIQPQLEFARRVGGKAVSVMAMVPQGANPHTYEPVPSQIANLAQADIYAIVGSGVEFELVWLDKLKATNKNMLIVDCSKDIELIETGEEHENSGHDNHHHGIHDPHIWMSPVNAIIMSKNIMESLVTIDNENSDYYKKNFESYEQDLLNLDTYIINRFDNTKNRTFITYHPAYAYFAKDYDLTMISIEHEGKEPSVADIARIIQIAREHNIKSILISPQFNPQSANIIASEINGKTIAVDILSDNYLANMQNLINELIKSSE